MAGIDGFGIIVVPQRGTEGRIPLTVGETVAARVVNLLPDGGVVLGVRGVLVPAVSDVPLQKDMVALFRVAALSADGGVRLQFQQYADAAAPERPANLASSPAQRQMGLPDARGGDASVPLQPGAFLRGRVGPMVDGTATLILPEGEIPVRPEVPLAEGTEVVVRVVPGPKGPELQVVPPAIAKVLTPFVGGDRQQALPPLRLDQTVATIAEAAEQLAEQGVDVAALRRVAEHFPDAASLTPVIVKQAVERAGVLFETRLRRAADSGEEPVAADDLKGKLLRALKTVAEAEPDGHDVAEVKKGLETLLRQVDDGQAASLAAGSLRTFLPLLWPGLQQGDLEFRRKPGDEDASSCRINLDLAEHGPLSLILFFSGGTFSIFLRPEKESFARLLADRLPEIRAIFARSGLALRTIEVVDPESRTIEQVEESMAAGGDVRVVA